MRAMVYLVLEVKKLDGYRAVKTESCPRSMGVLVISKTKRKDRRNKKRKKKY